MTSFIHSMQIRPETHYPIPESSTLPHGTDRIPYRYHQSMPSPWYGIINHSRSSPASFIIPAHKKRQSTCSRKSLRVRPASWVLLSNCNWMFITHFISFVVSAEPPHEVQLRNLTAPREMLFVGYYGKLFRSIRSALFTNWNAAQWNKGQQRKSHELIIS